MDPMMINKKNLVALVCLLFLLSQAAQSKCIDFFYSKETKELAEKRKVTLQGSGFTYKIKKHDHLVLRDVFALTNDHVSIHRNRNKSRVDDSICYYLIFHDDIKHTNAKEIIVTHIN